LPAKFSLDIDHLPIAGEKVEIIAFQQVNPLEGYRRLTYMMIDQDIVAVSPSSTYRVLKQSGLLQKWARQPSKRGTGFEQPLPAHQHWHVEVSHICHDDATSYLQLQTGLSLTTDYPHSKHETSVMKHRTSYHDR
jgi:hypothetical protein